MIEDNTLTIDADATAGSPPLAEGLNTSTLRQTPTGRATPSSPPPPRRTIRRRQLREIVPLADTTIYEMEQRGEFPRRFYLTSRCVVWDLAEVEAWIEQRRRASDAASVPRAPTPDVQLRKTRPVKRKLRP